jgi:hypothetical protein
MEDLAKLTGTQLLLLSAASRRDDGALEPRPKLTGGAIGKVVAKLLTEELVEEVRAPSSLPMLAGSAGLLIRGDRNERP